VGGQSRFYTGWVFKYIHVSTRVSHDTRCACMVRGSLSCVHMCMHACIHTHKHTHTDHHHHKKDSSTPGLTYTFNPHTHSGQEQHKIGLDTHTLTNTTEHPVMMISEMERRRGGNPPPRKNQGVANEAALLETR
jgi:hypothetical protein